MRTDIHLDVETYLQNSWGPRDQTPDIGRKHEAETWVPLAKRFVRALALVFRLEWTIVQEFKATNGTFVSNHVESAFWTGLG